MAGRRSSPPEMIPGCWILPAWRSRNWLGQDAALSAIDRAIVLNPNFALAFGHRAIVLAYLNRPDEAILIRASGDPSEPARSRHVLLLPALALAHLTAGRYEGGCRGPKSAARKWRDDGASPQSSACAAIWVGMRKRAPA